MSGYQQPSSPDIYSRMVEQADQLAKDRVERNAEIARLKAENQRLREALERIATANLTRYKSELTFARRMRKIAREALAGDTE